MPLFNLCNQAKGIGCIFEPFLIGHIGKTGVQCSPLHFLPGRRSLQLSQGAPGDTGGIPGRNRSFATFKELIEQFAVLQLVFGRLKEDASDLFIALLFGYAGGNGVAVPGLRFTGKGSQQILFSF